MENLKEEFMGIALKTAQEAKNISYPNPMVGAILLKDGEIIGKGTTQEAGRNHAEISAIDDVKKNFPLGWGKKIKDSSLYVTLEPCSKTGRTPPCSEEIVKNKIKEVFIGSLDPSQNGMKKLEALDLKVESGILKKETDKHHRGFLTRINTKKPFVKCKIACSIDGGMALKNGESKWITSKASRNDAHQVRHESDAILTGIGTVLSDDPKMTVRHINTEKQPIVCVLDTELRLNGREEIFNRETNSYIFSKRDNKKINNQRVRVKTVDIKDGALNLKQILEILAEEGVSELMIEAGPKLVASFINEDLIDEYIFYLAPKVMGKNKISFLDFNKNLNNIALQFTKTAVLDCDLKIIARRT